MERTKFNVDKDIEKRSCDGHVFASVLEMRYYQEVVVPGIADGNILHYELQKPYLLQEGFSYRGMAVRPVVYVADFYLVYADGTEEVIDTKGMADSVAKLKRKLFWHTYPDLVYTWVGYSKMDGGWLPYDQIQKFRRKRTRARHRAQKRKGLENG